MAVGRAVRAALALVIATAAGDAAAQAIARPVAIYPFPKTDGAAAEDAAALLETALQRATSRMDFVVVSEPIFTRQACGPAPAAAVDCLQKLAGKGIVLRAVLHKSERTAALAVEAVDGVSGRTFGPMTVGIDTFIQNAEPLARALVMLFEDVRSAARRQAGPLPKPIVVAPPLTPKADLPAPDAAKAPPKDLRAAEPAQKGGADAAVKRSAQKRPWARAAAPWVAGAGIALLAGAAGVAVMNQDLSNELDQKYRNGTLTPADAARYDEVKRNNTLTLALAAAGGALTLTSAYMFTVTPSQGGASVALAGRF